MENKAMQISHAEAMQLMEFQTDHTLHGDKENILNEHLKGCAECRAYAQQSNQLEKILKSVMHKQWDLRPAPLSVAVLLGNKFRKKASSAILLTRTALVSIAFMAFIVIGWQFTTSNSTTVYGTQYEILPNPTPSTPITATTFSTKNCTQIHYQVQENETLDSIASHFTTSKETIMNLNNLTSEAIQPNTELVVPICDTTPTSTLNPPTFTITPFLDPTTSTPG
jgi:LysM repeat protein